MSSIVLTSVKTKMFDIYIKYRLYIYSFVKVIAQIKIYIDS